MPTVPAKEFFKDKQPTLVRSANSTVNTGLPQQPLSNQFIDLTPGQALGTIGNSFKSGVEQMGQGFKDAQSAWQGDKLSDLPGNILRATESGLKSGGGLVGAAFSPLAPVFKPIGGSINWLSDKISDVPAVQSFAQSRTGEYTSRAAEDIGNLSAIAQGGLSLGGVPKGVDFAKENIGRGVETVSNAVAKDATAMADQVSRGAQAFSPLGENTKTALARTSEDAFNKFVEQGRQALADDRIRTPLESVGDNIIDGLKQMKDRAEAVGKQKSQYLDQAKIGLKRTGTIVRDAALQMRRVFNGMKVDPADVRFVNDIFSELKKISKNPTLKEVDRTIDLIQDKLYKASRSDVVEVTDRVTGPIRQIIGELNNKAGLIGGEAYRKFNSNYRDLITTVNELNARLGKEGASAGSFVKRLFSPSDARTKYLFGKLQEFTGQDYYRDARIAKYVMDSLGDKRGISLLEGIPTTPRGVFMKGVDYGLNKILDPINSAQKYIQKVGSEVAKLHPEDTALMDRFITEVRNKGKLRVEENYAPFTDSEMAMVEHLAKRFGISMDRGLHAVANMFEDILSGKKKVKGTIQK